MKTLHLSIIAISAIVVIGTITFAIIMPSQPKRIAGLENDSGIVTLGNQAYYFTTVNDTMTTYQGEGIRESFHDVVFTFFPRPFSGGPPGSCGNTNFGSDLKFTDNTHELLGVGIPGMPCGENYIQTVLSNHTNPQAGLAVYDQKIKLLVGMQSESVVLREYNQITHYYDGATMKPKVELYDYYYDGIGKDNTTVSINNKTYYQTTLNYADYDLKKGTSIQFQNVTFAFPEGVMNTPGGSFIMLDVKFPDGSEEIYGENKKNPDGSGALGGIGIPTQYGPHLSTNSTTVLGNHTMPQAGLTIYNDKIKLLVSKVPQLSQQLATACTAGPGMSCDNSPVIISQNNGTNLVSHDELDRIHTLCNNPIISTNGFDTLITCPIPANVASWIDISSPVYKITPCRSTYGCSGSNVYIQQNQDTMISEKQKEELENFVLKGIPEAKSWQSGWKLDHVEIQVRPNGVFAYMQFFIPVVNPTYKYCGWYPQVSVDLERKEIIGKENIIPGSNIPCTK